MDKPRTQRELAERYRLSEHSVSVALNDRPGVSDSTRARIKRLAEEAGIAPRGGRRKLAIGVCVPDLTGVNYAEWANMIIHYAERHGYAVVVQATYDSEPEEERAANTFKKLNVEGVILTSSRLSPSFMAIMNSEGVPVVSLRTRVDGPLSADDNVTPDNPQIDLDHFSGAYEAASYLVNECGHEIVACIRGPATSVSAQAKFEGVRAALGDRLSPRYVISAQTYDYQAGYDRMAELWGWPAKPTALLCYNDELALGALRYCYDNGISVPGHLDIVGYDDIRPARFAYPALSTVRVPRDGLARLAVDIIHLQTYLGRTTPYRLEEQPHLVLRGSVGMPARARAR